MIALIGNRPAIQVGRHQVHQYDTRWLGDALRRAATAAESENFPFLDEIRLGIEEYLETRCKLQVIPLPTLFDRVRRMLRKVGCGLIAENLEPVAPPVTLSLDQIAREIGDGFELAFYEQLRTEISDLRQQGVEQLYFDGLREAVRVLRRCDGGWNDACQQSLEEIRAFLMRQHREFRFGLSEIEIDSWLPE
ncbi:hypothetical protein [Haloferula sp. A504]|uniref:hypothetical protein n=1 Tax=Haloferula sp. A504 TaxID=3373601 RepID=UPI0031C557D2|nr:hypothetical protein [Verrucomicrobiaceae bacterium E54]